MLKLPNYRDISAASNQVATKSAMNPMLWKSAIAFPVGAVCAVFAPEPLNYMILTVASLPIIVGSIVFPFFARFDPDRLQSETHIENMEILARFGVKGSDEVITIESDQSASNQPKLGGK